MMILKRIIGWIIILSFVAFIIWQSCDMVSKEGVGSLFIMIGANLAAVALMALAIYLISSHSKNKNQ